MRRALRLGPLALLPMLGLAAYTYWVSGPFQVMPGQHQVNGTAYVQDDVLRSGAMVGGSLIFTGAVPDGTASYEVKTMVRVMQVGSYLHYLRASLDADHANLTGTQYYAVQLLADNNGGSGPCTGYLSIHRRRNGSTWTLANAQTPCRDNMVMRSVMRDDGRIRVYLDDVLTMEVTDTLLTGGQPGVGVSNCYNGSGLATYAYGLLDRTAPPAITMAELRVTPYQNAIEIQWPGRTDEANGSGFFRYRLLRNGSTIAIPQGNSYIDLNRTAGTNYNYRIDVEDYHGNAAQLSFSAMTTASAGRNPRQVGTGPLATTWGSLGENIDLQSGNLNFSLPLLKAGGRGMSSLTVGLSYNSLNWRQDTGGGTYSFAWDVGYGYGWRVAVAGLARFLKNDWETDHYVMVDSSGAEYVFTLVNGQWVNKTGLHCYYIEAENTMYWPDGTRWIFGALSGGNEWDAGMRYVSQIRDTNGNLVNITYRSSSGRVLTIEDPRTPSGQNRTYTFTYADEFYPRLTGIDNNIGTGERWQFGYGSNFTLRSPWDGGSNYGSPKALTSVTNTVNNQSWTFQYSANGAGELTKVILPQQAELSWDYTDFTYQNGQKFREVNYRHFKHTPGATAWDYWLNFDAGTDSGRVGNVHGWRMVGDPSGANRFYVFGQNNGDLLTFGRLVEVEHKAGSTLKAKDFFGWAQTAGGRPYMNRVEKSLDHGTGNEARSKREQDIDEFGNVTAAREYDYGNLSTPARTYSYSYLSGGTYDTRNIRNRLTSATVTQGSQTVTLVTNQYDQTTVSSLSGIRQYLNPGTNYRGNVTTVTQPGTSRTYTYNEAGEVTRASDPYGRYVDVASDSTKNYAVPASMTPNGNTDLRESMTWNSWLGLTQDTAPNSSITSTSYDGLQRPTEVVSPHGAKTVYSYNDGARQVTATVQDSVAGQGNGRWTRTTYDGIGRPVLVETGVSGSGTATSVVETEYAPCACSPVGKVYRVSRPYAPGGTKYWTTYSYDCLGRTTTVAQPASSGSTTYAYAGRDVTVTDPGGKWKKYRSDAFGRLIQVEEPNPAGGTWFTYYTFDALGKLTQVQMPRGGTTQTRTWVYSSTTQRLTSMTQPETGTTTFTYSQERLASKCEASNKEHRYNYDSYGRLISIYKGVCGGGTDLDRTITFQYDSGEAWQTNLKGRLAKISYKIGQGGSSGGQEPAEDFFAYTAAGLITRKDWRMQRSGVWMGLMSTYGYDAEGRRTAMRYPTQGGVPALALEYRYDALSRLQRVATTGGGTVWADNAQYGVGGELTSLTWNNWTESRSYNALGQLTRQTIAGTADIEYVFSGTQNDGRITERKDYITGEQVVYQYDALGRLINATTGATGPQWGYSYTFDGFSNLYRKDVTKGSVPTLLISVDPATNRINTSGFGYSGNGNLTNAPGGWTYTYDPSNRMVTAAGPSGSDNYSYDAANKRVYRRKPDGAETIFFWSAAGELLGEFALSGTTLTGGTIDTQYIYFAGKMIRAKNQGVVTDRLGSVVYRGTTRINYYPYGEEQPTVTANDNFKYGTYFRDNTTGLDYAQNRLFSSTLARFQSADPYQASGGTGQPNSWNRYSYVLGDPVGYIDPDGLQAMSPTACISTGAYMSPGSIDASTNCPPGQMEFWYPYYFPGGGGGGGALPPEPDPNESDTSNESGTPFASVATRIPPCPLPQFPCTIWNGTRWIVISGATLWEIVKIWNRSRGQSDPSQTQTIPARVPGTSDEWGNCIPPVPGQKGPAGMTWKWQQRSHAPNANPNALPHWHWTIWDFAMTNCMWYYRGRGESMSDPGPGYLLIPGIF